MADPGAAHLVLLGGAEEGSRRLRRRPCSKAITSIGTVSIWWGATLAIFVLLFMWALRRGLAGRGDALRHRRRLPAVVLALADRTIYSFYEVAFVPWVVLACVYVLGLILGGRDASLTRRRLGYGLIGAFVC